VLRRVAVFASQLEVDTPTAFAAAFEVGRLLGDNGIVMVYGGAGLGAMATAADKAIEAGGQAKRFQDEEEFRAEVAARVDAIIGLPGGFASLDEAFAVWSWSSDSGREQPLGLLDLDDYYSGLFRGASDQAIDRFVRDSQRGQLVVSKNAEDLLRRLGDYRSPETRRNDPGGFES
jgi:predicted Rossmann-fold nucleotide-binding protein